MKDRILRGDVRVLLKRFPNELVDCIITSPPYFKLRDYGSGKLEIGQEKTVQEYLKTLFNIFTECKRILKSTGSLWINLGDTYSKVNKSLLGIPFRLATMLLDDGLILRNTLVWCLEETTKLVVQENDIYKSISLKDLDITKNCKVLTQNSKGEDCWVKIKNKFFTGLQDCYKVTTKTGRVFTATGEHKVPYKACIVNKGAKYRKLHLKQIKDLKLTDCLYVNEYFESKLPEGNDMDYSEGFICGFFVAEGNYAKNRVGKYKDNPLSFATQKRWGRVTEHNKIVGARFSCGIKDEERGYLQHFERFKIQKSIYGNNIVINTTDKDLLNLLLTYISGEYCTGKYFNNNMFKRSKKFLKGLLDGFLGGDGHYDTKNDRWIVGIAPNYCLLDSIQVICRFLGYSFRFCSVLPNKYKGCMRFTIRKNPIQTRVFNCITDKIECIEFVGKCNTYDLEVDYLYSNLDGKETQELRKQKFNNLYFLHNGIWTHNCKPAVIPESVKDRFTNDFEYLFFFTKEDNYYFEQQFEPRVSEGGTAPYGSQGVVGSVNSGLRKKQEKAVNQFRLDKGLTDIVIEQPSNYSNSPEGMRNKRTVWTINAKPYRGHCGSFPPDLVRTPILATCPVGGLILDVFMGSGTVAEVAIETNRHYLGIELNSDYIKLAEERIRGVMKRVHNGICL